MKTVKEEYFSSITEDINEVTRMPVLLETKSYTC